MLNIFKVNYKYTRMTSIDIVLMVFLLTLNILHTSFYCFYFWLWTSKCRLCLGLWQLTYGFSEIFLEFFILFLQIYFAVTNKWGTLINYCEISILLYSNVMLTEMKRSWGAPKRREINDFINAFFTFLTKVNFTVYLS